MSVQHEKRMVSTRFLSPFVAVLALVAVLYGVFALHSESTGHDMHLAGSAMSQSALSQSALSQSAMSASAMSASVDVSTAVVASLVAPVVATLSASTHGNILDCALMAMACVLLLVLIGLVFFSRLTDSRRRRLEPPTALLGVAAALTAPAPRPSLIFLSISRV